MQLYTTMYILLVCGSRDIMLGRQWLNLSSVDVTDLQRICLRFIVVKDVQKLVSSCCSLE